MINNEINSSWLSSSFYGEYITNYIITTNIYRRLRFGFSFFFNISIICFIIISCSMNNFIFFFNKCFDSLLTIFCKTFECTYKSINKELLSITVFTFKTINNNSKFVPITKINISIFISISIYHTLLNKII